MRRVGFEVANRIRRQNSAFSLGHATKKMTKDDELKLFHSNNHFVQSMN